MVSESKEAVASDSCSHSSLFSSLSSSPAWCRSSRLPLITHPSISLSTLHFRCVLCCTVATDVNIHDVGVCFPPNGLEVASMISRLTTSWYFFNFSSLICLIFHPSWLLKTTTCTIVPHTEYRFCNPVPCPSLLPHAGQVCFLAPTRDFSKVPAHTQSVHSIMDNIRFFRYSSIAGFGFCPMSALH